MSFQIARCAVSCIAFIALAAGMVGQESVHTVSMELRHNMPFVEVSVNGRGPFTFGIDTGTGGEALVSPALIEQLALPVIGEAEVGDPIGNNPQKGAVMGLSSLSIDGIEFKNVKAVRFQPSTREGQCDGILGFVLFREYLLTLDYPRQQLTIEVGSLKPDGGDTVVAFTMPNNVPLVQLRVGSQMIDTHLDSRGMGLSFPKDFANGLKFASKLEVIGRGRTVSSEFEIKGAQLAGNVNLGGYTFVQPFVEVNPVFRMANFGSIPLHHFAVSFDQKNKLVRLVSADKKITIAPPQRRGMAPAEGGATPAPNPGD